MMTRLIYFLLFLALSAMTYAQPGYLGKKFSADYCFEATPLIRSVSIILTGSADENEFNDPFVRVVTGHHANFSLAITRKAEMFVHAGLRNLDYRWTYEIFNIYGLQRGYQNLPARENYLDLGFRHYPFDFIAPVGLYHQASIGVATTQFKESATLSGIVDHANSYYNSNVAMAEIESSKFVRLTYGFGVKRIITNYIYFVGDVNAHLFFPGLHKEDVDPKTAINTNRYIETILLNGFPRASRFSVKFGIGSLF